MEINSYIIFHGLDIVFGFLPMSFLILNSQPKCFTEMIVSIIFIIFNFKSFIYLLIIRYQNLNHISKLIKFYLVTEFMLSCFYLFFNINLLLKTDSTEECVLKDANLFQLFLIFNVITKLLLCFLLTIKFYQLLYFREENIIINPLNNYQTYIFDNSEKSETVFKIINKKIYLKELQNPITLEPFNNGDEILILACQHYFEKKSLIKWFTNNTTCPLCRHQEVV
jgi:hypothetical protein